MLKNLLISFIFVVATHFSFAQIHAVGLSYGYVFDGGATKFVSLDGGSAHHYQSGTQFSLNYSYQKTKNLKLISGLQFQQSFMQTRNGSSTGELQTWNFQVDNLNIPFLAHFTFLKYLFVEGGPVLNFQTNEVNAYGIDDQSGIGLSLGLGIQYDLGKFNLFMKTQTQMQSLIPFNREGYHDRLIANSLSFGIFYQL